MARPARVDYAARCPFSIWMRRGGGRSQFIIIARSQADAMRGRDVAEGEFPGCVVWYSDDRIVHRDPRLGVWGRIAEAREEVIRAIAPFICN